VDKNVPPVVVGYSGTAKYVDVENVAHEIADGRIAVRHE
jgi:hypothetical protein